MLTPRDIQQFIRKVEFDELKNALQSEEHHNTFEIKIKFQGGLLKIIDSAKPFIKDKDKEYGDLLSYIIVTAAKENKLDACLALSNQHEKNIQEKLNFVNQLLKTNSLDPDAVKILEKVASDLALQVAKIKDQEEIKRQKKIEEINSSLMQTVKMFKKGEKVELDLLFKSDNSNPPLISCQFTPGGDTFLHLLFSGEGKIGPEAFNQYKALAEFIIKNNKDKITAYKNVNGLTPIDYLQLEAFTALSSEQKSELDAIFRSALSYENINKNDKCDYSNFQAKKVEGQIFIYLYGPQVETKKKEESKDPIENKEEDNGLGWKIHISLAYEPPDNIAKAWNIAKDILVKYGISVSKVLPQGEFFEQEAQQGKEITLYDQPNIKPETWQALLEEMTIAFAKSGIKPGFLALPDKQIPGSPYFSTRSDKGTNNEYAEMVNLPSHNVYNPCHEKHYFDKLNIKIPEEINIPKKPERNNEQIYTYQKYIHDTFEGCKKNFKDFKVMFDIIVNKLYKEESFKGLQVSGEEPQDQEEDEVVNEEKIQKEKIIESIAIALKNELLSESVLEDLTQASNLFWQAGNEKVGALNSEEFSDKMENLIKLGEKIRQGFAELEQALLKAQQLDTKKVEAQEKDDPDLGPSGNNKGPPDKKPPDKKPPNEKYQGEKEYQEGPSSNPDKNNQTKDEGPKHISNTGGILAALQTNSPHNLKQPKVSDIAIANLCKELDVDELALKSLQPAELNNISHMILSNSVLGNHIKRQIVELESGWNIDAIKGITPSEFDKLAQGVFQAKMPQTIKSLLEETAKLPDKVTVAKSDTVLNETDEVLNSDKKQDGCKCNIL